jgi:hypothetical protein
MECSVEVRGLLWREFGFVEKPLAAVAIRRYTVQQ